MLLLLLSFLLIILVLLLITFCIYIQWQGNYWKKQQIDGPASFSIFGNMYKYVIHKMHYAEICDQIYKTYPLAIYVGFYKIFNKPAILIRDLNLIKEILIKNFNSFQDNDFLLDEHLDPLFTNSPFVAKGEKWKIARSHVAPMLTQSRIKNLLPIIDNVCTRFVNYLNSEINNNNDNVFEAKRLSSCFTLEIVASCAFGIEAETFTRKNSNFQIMTDKVFSPHQRGILKTTATLFLPFLSTLLRMPFLTKEIDEWLRRIFQSVVNMREQQQQQSDGKQHFDILQSLIHLKMEKNLSDTTICGYASSFLFDGYDTTSTVMTYSIYELAINEQVQRKAQNEIDNVLKKYNGQLNDESINELHYLEALIYESLRLHPPMLVVGKVCTQNYKLSSQYNLNTNNDVIIKPGTTIIIPVLSIHRDPKIFQLPNNFNPERFLGDNKKEQDKYAFLGFGSGPRICLGMKFAIVQLKAGLATLLSQYNINLSSKTKLPLKISCKTFLLQCDKGIWITLNKREKR